MQASRRESWASSPRARKVMQGNKSRDTAPEIAVRRLLHAAGLRYRVSVRPEQSLRRTADIVFTRSKVVNGHSKVPGFGQVEVPTLCGVDH